MSGLWVPPQYRPHALRYPVANREPISIAIITAASQATGVILTAEAFALAVAVTTAVVTATVITGAQFALNKTLSDKKGTFAGDVGVGGINAPEVRGNIRQSSPAQRIIYGRTRVGGAVSFLDTETPPYLYLQLLLSARRITNVLGLRLSTNDIAFAGFQNNVPLTPLQVEGQHYYANGVSRLVACFRDGDPDQPVDALLAADFPLLDPEFRQREIATASFKFTYGTDRTDFERMWGQGGIPSPAIEVEGAAVYDPRDPEQVEDDEESWQFSRNASLIQADWLRQPYGVNFPSGRIDWDKVADAADFDDEIIVNDDGTSMARHTIDGVVQLNQKPREVMEAMLTANRGFVVQSQGRGWVQSCTPRTPILTITDGLIVGGFEFRDDKAKRDTFNKVTSRFSSSDRQYQDIDGPILERADLISEDEETLEATVRIPFTSDHRAVQRLQKQYLAESRLPRSLSCRVKMTALCGREVPEVGQCVVVDSNLYTRMNTTYTIEEMGFSEDFSTISFSLVEYDATIAVAWNPDIDEQPFTLPEIDLS